MAVRIRDRAIRRAGELLKQIEPANGANQNIGAGAHPKVETRKEVAEQAGMSPHQAKQAIRVANIPAEDFEKQVESDKPPDTFRIENTLRMNFKYAAYNIDQKAISLLAAAIRIHPIGQPTKALHRLSRPHHNPIIGGSNHGLPRNQHRS